MEFDYKLAVHELNILISGKMDASHGMAHFDAVLNHVLRALDKTTGLSVREKRNIQLAAFLHDADDHKYFLHKNYENARRVLAVLDIDAESVSRIIDMISLVSCSTNGNSATDGEYSLYPRYADRLESIGEIGIARCYLYSKHVNRPLFDDTTPRATNTAELAKIATRERFDDYVNKRGKVGQSSFIDHFYDKLLHLNDFGTNEYFVAEANQRMEQMKEYVLNFGKTGTIDEEYLEMLVKKYKL